MQKVITLKDMCHVTKTAPMAADVHGGRAKCLQRLIRLDMPVPTTVALSFDAVRAIAGGLAVDTPQILRHFDDAPLLSVRPSSMDPDWGGPGAMLNIGMNDDKHTELSETIGFDAATRMYMRYIQSFAVEVARLDPEEFYLPDQPSLDGLKRILATYEHEMDAAFPQDVGEQLAEVLRSMARSWEGTTARLLRQAKGAPPEAGLGLVVQDMAIPVGDGVSGAGVIQFVESKMGTEQIKGRFVPQASHSETSGETVEALFLTKDPRGPSLEEQAPEAFKKLIEFGALGRIRLREEMEIKFILNDGDLSILDAVRVQRSSRAAVRIAVDLAASGVIPKKEAVLRVQPAALSELLHRQIDRNAKRDIIVKGIPASPGAARGILVFCANEAQASASRGGGLDCLASLGRRIWKSMTADSSSKGQMGGSSLPVMSSLSMEPRGKCWRANLLCKNRRWMTHFKRCCLGRTMCETSAFGRMRIPPRMRKRHVISRLRGLVCAGRNTCSLMVIV